MIRSNLLEALADDLAERIAADPPSPLETEIVAVPGQGMRSWLGQQLARRIGVFAGVRTPFPRDLIDDLLFAACGERGGEETPFQPGAIAFAIAQLLPSLLDERSFAPIASYLEGDERGAQLHQLARVLARTYDEYLLYRPEMILGWQDGEPSGDWQSTLWNALRGQIGPSARHVAETARDFLRRAADGGLRCDRLPRRLSLFGMTTLPPLYVRILAALPEPTEVRLYQLSPTPHYFGDLTRREAGAEDRGADGHPLLASLGRVGREFQDVLIDATSAGGGEEDLFALPRADTALGALQRDLYEVSSGPPPAADGTIQIHACHGPAREAEVLVDRLLETLDDSRLEAAPHELLVMTPDLETYAPYLEAAFARSAGAGRAIPFRVSDRKARSDSPAVEAFADLLELAGGRLRLSEVIDFLSREPVRENFGLEPEDVETLRRWLRESGVRFAADDLHRERLSQPRLLDHTWRFGLDRLLLGHALSSGSRRLFGGVAPCDSVAGGPADLLDGLVRFCGELLGAVEDLRRARSPAAWRDVLIEYWRRLIGDPDPENSASAAALEALDSLARSAELAGFDRELEFEAVRLWVLEALDALPASRSFLAGGVTICELKPMRGIPARAVALVGMNDGFFPRSRTAPSFDLISRHSRPGDRSVRDDDRYQLLEALISARDRLIITYTAHDDHTGEPLPPSVAVQEILDAIDPGSEIRHPLHPFDPRYFAPAGSDSRLFSYAAEQLPAARSLLAEPRPRAPFVAGRLEPDPAGAPAVDLWDLLRFFRFPAEFFLDSRLGVRSPRVERREDDREPADLKGLNRYNAGQAALEWRLAGRPADDLPRYLGALGLLPHGEPGRIWYESMLAEVEPLIEAGHDLAGLDQREPLELNIRLEDAPCLVGRLGDLRSCGLVACRFSRMRAGVLLQGWIRHLALCCAAPGDLPRRSALIGRPATDKKTVVRVDLPPLGEEARELLARLLRIYLLGRAEPLPFHPETSFEYAREACAGKNEKEALAAARKDWKKKAEKEWFDSSPAERCFADGNLVGATGFDESARFEQISARVLGPLIDRIGEAWP
ncbi:MAG: exodeoxyribonuclease V subunit gamma [Polyangia bacterium]